MVKHVGGSWAWGFSQDILKETTDIVLLFFRQLKRKK